ncbi:hypothetical protein O181_094302 [Austropuccinia psidii MF-1]|uniref:Uncharacterized protein n=1 Tax=Austropuccinia psidii MF-1 TaxID=1389203 RepID=A0A9Q3PBD9_9BASI|nr:hypothetical protein [Austropuccinia psidii MF-1]
MKEELNYLLHKYKSAFATEKGTLGATIGYGVDIILNVEEPYPTLLIIPAYSAIPRAREALEVHIEYLMNIWALRKVGSNEHVSFVYETLDNSNNIKSTMTVHSRKI